jgi:hypothetical protein
MAVIAERLALAGINGGAEKHKVIYTTNGFVEGVVAVRTGPYVVGIRMIRIGYDV